MDRKNIWTRDPMDSCGLVVVFPDAGANLWDAELNRMVSEIEDRLDGAVVNFALLNGRHPSLVDAMVATRFVGCTQAVVAVVGGGTGLAFDLLSGPGGAFPVTIAGCRRDPEAVVQAYYSALLSEPAACA